LADYQIRVSADTSKATSQLVKVDKAADKATKPRKIEIGLANVEKVAKQYKNINSSLKEAANDIKKVYGFSKKIPGFGERVEEVEAFAKGTANLAKAAPGAAKSVAENAKATKILSNSLGAANNGLMKMVTNLAKVGFAIYAVKEAVGILNAAYSAFFNNTIGREIQLQETILKTQATLASNAKVFADGEEITDPYEKIVSLTGQIEGNIDSIRKRSLELAGVTSGDVIEVFGMVASQISQIGGGLDEAEDLAIQFSAALGTFGIPLYQARQEIGSILRGDITMDSYLAKALGITNEDVAKAKTTSEGLIGFLEKRLAASVAGQKLAAQQFAGVVSNIAEIFEEVGRNFGKPLLQPILAGLTAVYNSLFGIFDQLTGIASEAGKGVAAIAEVFMGLAATSPIAQALSSGLDKFATDLQQKVVGAFAAVKQDVLSLFDPLQNLFNQVAASAAMLVEGLAALAVGLGDITIENIKQLVKIFSNLAQIFTPVAAGLSEILKLYGELLKIPVVQYLSQIALTFGVLQKLGVTSIVKLVMVAGTLKAAWAPIVGFFQKWAARVSVFFKKAALTVSKAFKTMSVAVRAFASTLSATNPKMAKFKAELNLMAAQMQKTAVTAKKAGTGMTIMAGGAKKAAMGIKGLIAGSAMFLGKFLLISIAISAALDLFLRWQQAQSDRASFAKANQALDDLAGKYKDVDKTSDAAARAAKRFKQALADAEYNKAMTKLVEIDEKIAEIEEKLRKGIAERGGGAGAMMSGSTTDLTLQAQLKDLQDQRVEFADFIAKYEGLQREKEDKRVIKTMAENRNNMEKQIADFRKKVEDDIFRQQQRLARLQLDKMRLQAEIETRKLSRELQERLKGEEGISRKVQDNLNKYLLAKKKGEDTIAQRQKSLQIELANLDKEIADYKYNIQKQIAKLQKDMGEFEKKVADYKLAKMREQARESSGGKFEGDFGDDVVGKLTAAIVSKESGGDYNAHNMDAGNGGAIGIGQVMAANVPSWTMKHYGESLTPEQYKKNHAAQNAVVRGQVKDYYTTAKSQGYSDEEAARRVASQWYSGNPDLHTNTRPQYSNGNEYPSISSYADDIVGRMGMAKAEAPVSPEVDKSMPDYNPVINAMERVKGLMVEINGLQDQLTGQDRVDAFNNILDGAYGDETGMEGLVDQANALNAQLTAISQLSGGPMDPATIQLTSQMIAERERLRLEKMQVIKSIQEDDKLNEEEKAQLLRTNTEEYNKGLEALNNIAAKKEEILGLQNAINYAAGAAADIESMQNQTQDLLLENRLKMEGMNDLQIRAELRKVRIYRAQQKALEGVTDPAARQKILDITNQQITAVNNLAKAQQAAANPMTRLYQQWKTDLSDVNGYYAQMAQTIQQELGNAMAAAITGVIDGSTTIQEAFANMFKNIGQAFIQMATQMIAKALIMKVLGIPMGNMFGGGGGGFGGGYFNPMTGLGAAGPNYGLAEGGFVDSPTNATIAEGGEPEYVIPQSKMDDSMARWNSGTRGAAVLDPVTGAGTGNGMGFNEEAFNPNIVINGGVMNYGGEDYIKRSELPGIVGQAAKSGEERALRKLRMSPSARKKIGL